MTGTPPELARVLAATVFERHGITLREDDPAFALVTLNELTLRKVRNHRLKAVALVTGCKPCPGQRPARWFPHQAGFQK